MNTDEPNFIKFLNEDLKIGESRTHAKKMDSSISDVEKEILFYVDICIRENNFTEALNVLKDLLEEKINQYNIVPLLYRKVIFYIAYYVYIAKQEDNVIPIYTDFNANKIRIRNQTDILKILELHKDSFNKWGMDSPFYIYKTGNDIGIKINLYRNGKKNAELCYIINQLIDQVNPSSLAEGFCGLGAVTVSKKRKNMNVFLNDGDNIIVNFLKVVKEHPKELKEECKSILNEIELGKESKKPIEYIYNEVLDEMLESNPKSLDNKDDAKKFIRKYINKISKIDIEKRKPIVKSANQVYKEKQSLKNKYSGRNIPVDKQIEVAGAFYFIHSFKYNGRECASGITDTSLKIYKKSLSKISEYSKALKCVKDICNEDIVNFIDILKNKLNNGEDILLYLDPPYPGTKGYDVKVNNTKLFKKLSEYQGKWILSCREKVNKVTREKKPDCLLNYFRNMGENLGTNLYVFITNNPQKEIMVTNFNFNSEAIDRGVFHCISKRSNKLKKADIYEKLSFEDFLKKLECDN